MNRRVSFCVVFLGLVSLLAAGLLEGAGHKGRPPLLLPRKLFPAGLPRPDLGLANAGVRQPQGRVAPIELVISEIMYHPADDGAEFIEFANHGEQSIDLTGFAFTDGIEFTFGAGTYIDPGDFLVLAGSEVDFQARYPGVAFAGVYTGRLSNAGEPVEFADARDRILISLTYDDDAPWPSAADGIGYSLVFENSAGDPANPANWRASAALDGSPGSGEADPGIPRLVINEALSNTDQPTPDAIEIFNPTDEVADIRAWLLSDDRQEPAKALIPDDPQYLLAPGEYAVISEEIFSLAPGSLNGNALSGFNLSAEGDGVYLFSSDQAGNLTGYGHGFEFAAAAEGVSFGRHLTSDGKSHFVAQQETTLGAANAGPRVGPVVIAQIHYHPLTDGIEYLVLANISAEQVNLFDDQVGGDPANTWVISGIGFSFAAGTTLGAGDTILVANSDASTFRNHYQVPAGIAIQGPFGNAADDNDAALDNGGEAVTLRRPDIPDGEEVPWITMDRIRFDDQNPWPAADGTGLALVRIDLAEFGNEPNNWQAAAPCFQTADCPDPPDPSALLFSPDRLIEVVIELDEADWEQLRGQDRSFFDILRGDCLAEPFASPFTYFPATVTVDGINLDNVGVRKKGFLGSLSWEKPSLKIKLDKYVDGQRLRGLRRLTLNNARQDPSLVDQCLGYQVFAAAGMVAPRCSFALVTVNGEALGPYVHVDSIKEQFLARHFTNSTGNLYEGTLSDFRPQWINTFERENNLSDPDRSDLEAMVAALEVADDELVAALQPLIDLDAFLTFWAIEVLVGHWDGYTGNTNNFYLYHDPDSDLFHFIPWGMDDLFIDPEPVEPGAPVPGVLAQGYLSRRLYLNPPTRQLYLTRMDELLADVWDETAILAEIDHMEALLSPHVGTPDQADFIADLDRVRDYVADRRGQLEAALEPEPPELSEPLRDAFCFTETGELDATFSTTWGSFDVIDPFVAGSGSFSATVAGYQIDPFRVGASAGTSDDPEAAGLAFFLVAGVLGDGTVGIVYVVTVPELIWSGAVIDFDWGVTIGYLLHFDPRTGEEPELIGFLGEGALELGTAATTPGAPVTGTLSVRIFEPF